MIPDESDRTVRLPVQWIDGEWKLEGGGPLPKLVAHASGELILPAGFLADEDERAKWTGQQVVDFLPKQTPLFARISPNHLPPEMDKQVVRHSIGGRLIPFVPLRLLVPLQLVLVTGKKGHLVGGKCYSPATTLEAESLNEALRKVSEQFEPTRRSFGGSAFELIYAEINHRLVKLADCRDRICDELERQRAGPQSRDSNLPGQSDQSTYGPQQQLDF
jgi:hypothetical protein